jgi:hypothetical protein
MELPPLSHLTETHRAQAEDLFVRLRHTLVTDSPAGHALPFSVVFEVLTALLGEAIGFTLATATAQDWPTALTELLEDTNVHVAEAANRVYHALTDKATDSA